MIAALVFGLIAIACILHAWRQGQLNKPPTASTARLVALRREVWQDRPEVK